MGPGTESGGGAAVGLGGVGDGVAESSGEIIPRLRKATDVLPWSRASKQF